MKESLDSVVLKVLDGQNLGVEDWSALASALQARWAQAPHHSRVRAEFLLAGIEVFRQHASCLPDSPDRLGYFFGNFGPEFGGGRRESREDLLNCAERVRRAISGFKVISADWAEMVLRNLVVLERDYADPRRAPEIQGGRELARTLLVALEHECRRNRYPSARAGHAGECISCGSVRGGSSFQGLVDSVGGISGGIRLGPSLGIEVSGQDFENLLSLMLGFEGDDLIRRIDGFLVYPARDGDWRFICRGVSVPITREDFADLKAVILEVHEETRDTREERMIRSLLSAPEDEESPSPR